MKRFSAVGDATLRQPQAVPARKIISRNLRNGSETPRVKVERADHKPGKPRPAAAPPSAPTAPSAAALLLLFLLLSVGSVSAIISPPIAGDTGSVYTNRLLYNLASGTTNRAFYTNSSRAFGDTNLTQFNIRSNTSNSKWEWRYGITAIATNTGNRSSGTWKSNTVAAGVAGYTRFEPTELNYVKIDALGAVVDPANFVDQLPPSPYLSAALTNQYRADIAASNAVANVTATNAATTQIFSQRAYDQLNSNLKLPWVYKKLYTGEPVKVFFYGDDAIRVQSEFIRHVQLHGIRLNGFGNSINTDSDSAGNFAMLGASAGVTTYNSDGASGTGLSPIFHFGLPNGGVVSNYSDVAGVVGWDMNMLTIKGWKDSTLGSIAVQTNSGWNKSTGWGTAATIDCSSGSWTYFTNYIYLGGVLTNGAVKVVSTASNVIQQASGYNTNLNSGWVFGMANGGTMGFEDFMQTTTWSNNLYSFLADQDLVIFSDVDGDSVGGIVNPITNFWNGMKARGYLFDVAVTTSLQESNGAPAYQTHYDSIKTASGLVPFAIYDTSRFLWPTNNPKLIAYYSDANHATALGRKILSQKFTDAVLPSMDLVKYGYNFRTTNFLTLPMDTRMRNDQGNSALTIVSPYTQLGTFYGQSAFLITNGSPTSFSFPVASSMFSGAGRESDARDIYTRLRVLTTNATTATLSAAFWIQTHDVVGRTDGNSYGAAAAAFTVGASGSTNFSATPWQRIGLTNGPVRGEPWSGYCIHGTSGSPSASFYIIAVDFMSVPRIPY